MKPVISPTTENYRGFTHQPAITIGVLPTSEAAPVDGHGVSPTFFCGWTRCFTHRRHGVSPTESPSKPSNGAGLRNRNARARFLTIKIFNVPDAACLWKTPSSARGLAAGAPSGFPRFAAPPPSKECRPSRAAISKSSRTTTRTRSSAIKNQRTVLSVGRSDSRGARAVKNTWDRGRPPPPLFERLRTVLAREPRTSSDRGKQRVTATESSMGAGQPCQD